MNVLSLFDGMSCGRIALDQLGIKVDNYFASEIDKHAIKVTQHNYPNTIQIGDVTKIKGNDLPNIDLLIGGSPCFPKGQRVITINGFKNIEDIKKGDMVLTHKGRYREVITPMERFFNGKLYKIRPTYYNFNIETTNEHPFFTQRGWVNAEDLKEDDYLSMPLNKESINPKQISYKQVINQHKDIYKTTDLPILDENFWKLVGYWVAEGWTRDKRNGKNNRNTYRIFLSVTERKMKFIQPVIEALGIHYRIEKCRTCDKITFGSKDYWLFIKQFTNGTRSTDKLIPEFVQNMPKHLIRAFVEGYKNGDGSENDEAIGYTSTSKILLEALQRLLLKTENKLYSLTQTHYTRQCIIEGRVVNAKDSYSLHKNKTDNKFAYFTEGYVFYKVRTITTEDVNELTVYNFEVDEDNSYCLPITTVHNCQGFSFSGKQLNFDDPRSKLFFEFVRLIKECKPKYWLLENVVMKKEFEQVITEHLGVEPIKINSALVSAQNRERLYWANFPIEQPSDKGIKLIDILEDTEMIRPSAIRGRRLNKATILGRRLNDKGKREDYNKEIPITQYLEVRATNRDKSNCLTTVAKDNVLTTMPIGRHPDAFKNNLPFRYYTIKEYCRLQTTPENYFDGVVSENQIRKMLGNGWTVEVIKHIFKNIKL